MATAAEKRDSASRLKALNEAIENVGGVTALALLLERAPSAVTNWKRSQVPGKLCRRIEAVTGVSAERLRPDVFLMP